MLFVLSFGNNASRAVHTKYYLSTAEINDFNVVVDRQIFFNMPVKTNFKNVKNVKKMIMGLDWLSTRLFLFQ